MRFSHNHQDHGGWHGCVGRHSFGGWGGRGGRHGGRHGRGGGDGLRAGRKLGSGDLQLLILHLLQESPRHGYELIKELESRTSGWYSPSPGVIYPALTYLEEIGFASVEAEGNKKLYRMTETGTAFLKDNQAAAEAMLTELAEVGRRFARAQQAMDAEDDDDDGSSAGSDDESELGSWPLGERRFGRGGRGGHEGFRGGRGAAIVEILQARHELKRAIRESIGTSPDAVKRIAEILRRAAAEIRGKNAG
jgi:DNA-binding PadR family transcriptional regulator